MKKTAVLSLLLACAMTIPAFGAETETEKNDFQNDFLVVRDGVLQPVLEVSDMRDPAYTNEGSDVLRFCVYVETDNDTDNDGMADLVKALVQVPRAAVEGKYKAGTIYDPTPYGAGTMTQDYPETDVPFHYEDLYRECEKREPVGEMSSMEAADLVDPARDWDYTVPTSPKDSPLDGKTGVEYAEVYDYYLSRGYAVVVASGIGTYGSEGFELCGTHLERDSHKAVVEWLAGNRRAFTDRTSNIEIKADWSNKKVAMTGVSYGGTLPFEVATTGVEGLVTVIPVAGIASWYDYTNSQGVSTIFDVNYADNLSSFNCGGVYLDKDWTVLNPEYVSWLNQIAGDQEATNGNYAPIWEESDYSEDWENIHCSALVIQGLNDYNVTTKQADLMVQAFRKAGANVRLVLHQNGHNCLDNTIVNGELWNETVNRWLAHYLYGVDNGAQDMPAVLVQSNIDGTWKAYDSWRDFQYVDAPVSYETATSVVRSREMAQTFSDHTGAQGAAEADSAPQDTRDIFYMNLTEDALAAYYPIELPENTTVYGVPEIHLKLSSEITEYEGLMITAVLVDTADDGSTFSAYMTKDRLSNNLPARVIGRYEGAASWGSTDIEEYVQDLTRAKVLSYGWTDLTNPGSGYASREYTETSRLEAGRFYDYTFYMMPTVYTVAPGHHLTLVLTTWDPYRAFLDESFENLDTDKDSDEIDYNYSYVIDNEAIQVRMPVAGE